MVSMLQGALQAFCLSHEGISVWNHFLLTNSPSTSMI
jgi:hypothetical protein